MPVDWSQEIQAWSDENPRLGWAFTLLDEKDELRERVLAGIVSRNFSTTDLDDLERFTDAVENYHRAIQAGTFSVPPEIGCRRPIPVRISRMTKMNWEQDKIFRVDFMTTQGWSGYFDTKNPLVVEQAAKAQTRQTPQSLVGEVERYIYKFLVVLGGNPRII